MRKGEFKISRTSQALYLTVVAKDRLPVFKSEMISNLTCRALDEARGSGGFLIFAYVLMPDHLHLITSQPNDCANVLRRVKGIIARRVIDYLKLNNFESSLAKLRHEEWKRKHAHSLWQQEKNVFSIYSESVFMQKVNYIHANPVRGGLVVSGADYRWSSARIWQHREIDDEPLLCDNHLINWRERA
jgi:REP element-mobilizing transposase RayT